MANSSGTFLLEAAFKRLPIIRYGFGSPLPSCSVKHFRVHPNEVFSIYRHKEAGRTIAIILPRC